MSSESDLTELKEKTMLERLSELEHLQWEKWSKTTLENITKHYPNKVTSSSTEYYNDLVHYFHKKWSPNWKPYSELTEEIKEYDRKYARIVLSEVLGFVVGKLQADLDKAQTLFEVKKRIFEDKKHEYASERLKAEKLMYAFTGEKQELERLIEYFTREFEGLK